VSTGSGDATPSGVPLVDESTDVVFRTDLAGVLEWVSDSVADVLGVAPDVILGRLTVDLVHPDDVGALLATRERVAADGRGPTQVLRLRTSSGGWREMSGRGVTLHDDDGTATGRLFVLRDIHDHSARLRALQTLSRGNAVLVRATDEQQLLDEMCATVVEAGRYALAWYGRPLDNEAHSVLPVASAGPLVDYVASITVTWDESPTGRGPTGTALRTGETQVNDDFENPDFTPWKAAAQERGFRSSISLPVRAEGRIDGALMVYARDVGAFDETARSLLEDLAADIGYGLERLRDAQRLAESLTSSVHVLAAAVEARDPYTAGHQWRVGEIAGLIGRELGLAEPQVEGLVLGAAIHDLGKIAISHSTLGKEGPLADHEWERLREHPRIGHDITQRVPWPWAIAEMILQHHERLDGSGYPRGLRGDEILIEARIIAVADTYEAMANDRPYRVAPGHDQAMDVLRSGAGRLFDRDVIDAFERVLLHGWTLRTD